MKNGKRIAAFALSLVVALGSVCYRPPKAEAVVVESALASAAISTYLSATGFEFFGGGSSNTEINEAIYGELCELTKAFAESINQLNDEVTTVITSGVTWAENGIVKFSAAAANMLGRFSDWLVDKFGLVAGGSAVGVVPSFGNGVITESVSFPVLPRWDTTAFPFAFILNGSAGSDTYYLYLDTNIYSFVAEWEDQYGSYDNWIKTDNPGTVCIYRSIAGSPWELRVESRAYEYYGFDMDNVEIFWSNFDIYSVGGSLWFASAGYDVAEDWDNPVLSASLVADYEAAPTVDEQHVMVVNTGLTFADEQSYIDAVLGGVAAGTLSPTCTIEETTAGDVTVPGEDAEDDTQVGILNWVKKIWQSVKELPQTIADAVANVFVPSEEYMATVPETIADTFGSRTGFLTYPTSVLYDFVDMLSETSGDFILSWPTVREPSTGGVMMEAGQFNVSKFVRDNQSLSDWYIIYRYAVGAYLTFLFFGLCRRKYNSVVGDRLGV